MKSNIRKAGRYSAGHTAAPLRLPFDCCRKKPRRPCDVRPLRLSAQCPKSVRTASNRCTAQIESFLDMRLFHASCGLREGHDRPVRNQAYGGETASTGGRYGFMRDGQTGKAAFRAPSATRTFRQTCWAGQCGAPGFPAGRSGLWWTGRGLKYFGGQRQ